MPFASSPPFLYLISGLLPSNVILLPSASLIWLDSKTAYVLEKPLQNYEQSITISGEIASYIAQILNDIKDNDDQNVVNPLCITQENIESMIILITQLLKEYKKNQEKSGAELEED